MTTPCECGCGQAANSRFVSGHNNRGRETKPRTEFTCEQCSKPFRVRIEPNGRRQECKFCSATCRDKHRRENAGPASPLYNRIEAICRVCRTPFLAVPSLIAKGATCSDACGRLSRASKMVGKKRSPSPHADQRKAAKVRDGFKCRMCGFAEVIHVHHIVPRGKGGKHNLQNLITLCPNHHAMVHAGMIPNDRLQEAIAAPHESQAEMPLTRVVNFRR